MSKSIVVSAISAALALGCSQDGEPEVTRVGTFAILAGQRSGDDENASVLIESSGEDDTTLFCTGHVVAPRLVLTARHCLLKKKTRELKCNPDGSPADSAGTFDQTLEAPERITVHVGATRAALRPVRARQILANFEIGLCRSDIAFLVLVDDALPIHRPFRREPVRVGDELTLTGWGYTSDDQEKLPDERSTRASVAVRELGPGFIPAGTFDIGGGTGCFGDSGAAARLGAAIVGVYSRLEGTACAMIGGRNIFTATAQQSELIARAFEAVGEKPVYDEESPEADAGVDAGSAAPAEPPPAGDTSGCAMGTARPRFRWATLGLVLLARRRRVSATSPRAGSPYVRAGRETLRARARQAAARALAGP